MATRVAAVFDVGKTNKKVLLLNEEYEVVYEESQQLPEITDPDGFPCEDIVQLKDWLVTTFDRLLTIPAYDIVALNFSGYGACFVHLDRNGNPVAPVYNYLKPFPSTLLHQFFQQFGDEAKLTAQLASPSLGMLNSGLQLYWLAESHPEEFKAIRYSLHLPQYLSFVFGNKPASELTSIGCHTFLWDFRANRYADWVTQTGVEQYLAPIVSSTTTSTVSLGGRQLKVGIGLHDSSAALIPYLLTIAEPFLLISTGTWSISLNPFNRSPLTEDELRQDCLNYISFKGTPVKSSRLFAGHLHDEMLQKLSDHFKVPVTHYQSIRIESLIDQEPAPWTSASGFLAYESAYLSFLNDLVVKQVQSSQLVLRGSIVRHIFVDGGFANNILFMHLLARHFSTYEVYAAMVPQASAIGAAMAIHDAWNRQPIGSVIQLKRYQVEK